MFFHAFWVSLFLTFWAEMGDKTQFVALAYATRYSVRNVLLGILWATAAIHILSVALGSVIKYWFPLSVINLLSATCFFGFAIWTYFEDEETESIQTSEHHPIIVVGIAFFLAELGDKTMFTAATLATTYGWFPVWAGSTLGMLFSDGIAVYVGRSFGKQLPKKLVKWTAITLFTLFGLWYAIHAMAMFR